MASVPPSACPACGFSYGWDGLRCRHCGRGGPPGDGFASLADLQQVLSRPDPAPDDVVADTFGRFQPSYSVLWSAGFVLGAAGLVCHLRPHLAGRVLARAIEPLFDLGARSADHVLCWADPLLEARRAALAGCAESILDPPRALLVGFAWFRPAGMNPNACLTVLLGDMVATAGPEGVEWLRANLPARREATQAVLDRLQRDRLAAVREAPAAPHGPAPPAARPWWRFWSGRPGAADPGDAADRAGGRR